MLARLANGAVPAAAFVMMVGFLASYDVIEPPLAAAARHVVDHIHLSVPVSDPSGVPASPAPNAQGLVEGKDWSPIEPADGLLRWPCGTKIPVRLIGAAPQGAGAALVADVTRLAKVSGLNLVAASQDPAWSNQEYRDGEIVVRYVDPTKRQAPGIAFNDDSAIGRGGPVWTGHTITAGDVAIRVDKPYFSDTDPTSPLGQAVLLHELGHAIGAGHSHDNEGVMQPSGADLDLSRGDKHVFRLLGCPR